MKMLMIESLEIGGEVDSDGEVCFSLEGYCTYLNREQVTELRNHLSTLLDVKKQDRYQQLLEAFREEHGRDVFYYESILKWAKKMKLGAPTVQGILNQPEVTELGDSAYRYEN